MDHRAAVIRLGRSQSLGARYHHAPSAQQRAGHAESQHVGLMQVCAGRNHVSAHLNTVQEDDPHSNARPSALSLLEPKSTSFSPRRCGGSTVPSVASTPTATSFDLSSCSSQTAQTSPPPTATFSFGRESGLGTEVAALGEVFRKTCISSRPGRANTHEALGLEMSRHNRRHRNHSEDLIAWRREASRFQDPALCTDLKSTAEESDEDLRDYRQDGKTETPRGESDVSRSRRGRTVSSITDIEDDDNTNRLSMADCAAAPNNGPVATPMGIIHQDPADRIAREVLAQEFSVFLGSSDPPAQVLRAFRKCLDDVSVSISSARSLGYLPSINATNPLNDSSASVSFGSFSASGQGRDSGTTRRKRPQHSRQDDDDDDDIHDDQSEDGSTVSPCPDLDHRNKAKIVQYPCPFRKRSPYIYNCREWEFCAKAPLKGMSELKKHIRDYHQHQQQPLAFICRRCHVGFVSEDDLDAHTLLPSEEMCAVRPGPRPVVEFAGINSEMANRLRSRAERFSWDTLWLALFPRDRQVPEPVFEPIVELHEVSYEYTAALPRLKDQITSLLKAYQPRTDPPAPEFSEVMGGNIERMFEELITIVFQSARSRAAGETPLLQSNVRRAAVPSRRLPAPVATPSTRTKPATLSTPIAPSLRPLAPRGTTPDRMSTASLGSATSVSSSARNSTFSLAQMSNRTSMTSTASSSAVSLANYPPVPALPALTPRARKRIRVSGQRQPFALHAPDHPPHTSPLRQSVAAASPAPTRAFYPPEKPFVSQESPTAPGVCPESLAAAAATKLLRHGGHDKENCRDSAASPPCAGDNAAAMPCDWLGAPGHGYAYYDDAPPASQTPVFVTGGSNAVDGSPATMLNDVMPVAEEIDVGDWTIAGDALFLDGSHHLYEGARL